MLVLSRKKNESIIIDLSNPKVLEVIAALPPEERVVTAVIVEIRGDKVRLGLNAPKELPVHRREVYDAIKRNGKEPGPGKSGKDAA